MLLRLVVAHRHTAAVSGFLLSMAVSADCHLEAGMLREGSQASKGRAGGVVKSSDERIPHAGWIHERRLKARYLTCSQRADAPCGVAAKASRAAVLPKMIDDFAARAGKTA